MALGGGSRTYFQWGIVQGYYQGGRSSIDYFLEPYLGYDLERATTRALDITNPTPFMITIGLLVGALLATRFAGERSQTEEVTNTLTSLNRCDSCGATFRNFNH